MPRGIARAVHAAHPGTLACLLLAASPAWAQAPAQPGQVLQDVERSLPSHPVTSPDGVKIEIPEAPELSPPASAERVAVRSYRFQGNTAFGQETLQALLAGRTGELSFAQLNAAASELTAYYRAHGYPLARAYLPQQEIRDGVVTIAILEGRYDRVVVHNGSRLSDERVSRTLDRPLCGSGDGCGGALIERAPLERALLLLSDLPGVQAAARLSPGSAIGTSTLDADVSADRSVSGLAQVDNTGSYYSGVVRAQGSLWVNNPAGIGDQLTVQAVGTTEHGQLHYGALGYGVPLGYDGLRMGLRGSYLDYQLGSRYRSLGAHGTVSSADAWLTYPFIRTRGANLSGNLGYGERRFHDSMDAAGSATDRRIKDRVEAALSADLRDDVFPLPGFNTASVSYTTGELRLDGLSAAQDATTARTDGHYAKWGVAYARLQPVAERTGVYVRAAAQLATKNLDSYEKFSLGGPDSVRAYPTGEAASDKAALYSVELRHRFAATAGSALEGVLFYDWAQGRVNASPWQAQAGNRVTLHGGGVGANVPLAEHVTLHSALAWRGDRPMTAAPDRHCNFALSLSAAF